MPTEQNYTSDISKAFVLLGGGGPNAAPGKTIGGLASGEAVRMESDQDRVSILRGLNGLTFKVMPMSAIGRLLTISLMESSKSIAYMDLLYQAGVPFNVVYRNGETNLAGQGMILGAAPEGISATEIVRVYRVGIIDVVGGSGAHATTGELGL